VGHARGRRSRHQGRARCVRVVAGAPGSRRPRLARASHLLKAGGGVMPYLLKRYDPRRRAASERRFFASSSWRDGPSRPMWPRRVLLTSSRPCWWRARGGSVRGEAYACGRRREIAAAWWGWEIGRGLRRGEIRSRPASTPSTAIYRGRCGRLHRRWGPAAR
jgi:hypothetical protein